MENNNYNTYETLKNLMDTQEKVTVITINGYQVSCTILGFDNITLYVRDDDGVEHIMFRANLSTVRRA